MLRLKQEVEEDSRSLPQPVGLQVLTAQVAGAGVHRSGIPPCPSGGREERDLFLGPGVRRVDDRADGLLTEISEGDLLCESLPDLPHDLAKQGEAGPPVDRGDWGASLCGGVNDLGAVAKEVVQGVLGRGAGGCAPNVVVRAKHRVDEARVALPVVR